MRLNLKEFKDIIKTFQGIVEFANKLCITLDANEIELDKYTGELYEEILMLCGYDDEFLLNKDPVLQLNETLDEAQLEEMYVKILQEISAYRIEKDPDGDVF